jgi:hypothetical protein
MCIFSCPKQFINESTKFDCCKYTVTKKEGVQLKQTPCKLLYTHTTCAHGLPQFWTQNLNLVLLFTKDLGTTYFRPLAGSLPTRHLRRHSLSDQRPSALTQPKNLQPAPSQGAANVTSQIRFFAEVFYALCSQG